MKLNELKEKFNETKNNMTPTKVLIASLAIVAITAVIGISWAWFSALPQGDNEIQGVTVETANLSITFANGPEYKAENVLPGWSDSKTFTVENTGDVEAHYSVMWAEFLNTFNNKNDIVYSISSTNSGGTLTETAFPSTGTNLTIINEAVIPVGTTQTYTMTMRFINRASTQDDQGSYVSGKLKIQELHQQASNTTRP